MSSNPNMSYCAAENTFRAMDQLMELLVEGNKDVDIRERTTEGKALEDIMYLAFDISRLIQDKIDDYEL
jgi:hypothetical protein